MSHFKSNFIASGLTAVVVGLYFVASLFLAPLFSSVPTIATSPVLVLVGVMMMSESSKIPWNEMNHALPAFLTIILMPLTYSITNGMIFGLAACACFYVTTGEILLDIRTALNSESNQTRLEDEALLQQESNESKQKEYGAVP